MKFQLFSILSLVSFLVIACNNQPSPPSPKEEEQEQEKEKHEEHNLLRENLAHKGIIILEEPYAAPKEFQQSIDTFFRRYLDLQDALVKADTFAANNAVQVMKNTLEPIAEPDWDKMATDTWNNHKKLYLKELTEFSHVKTLEEKRAYFSHISEILYCTFKSFNLGINNVQVAFCAMAFDNKGAYWLTNNAVIKNPYFGDKMLDCGSIEEVITYDEKEK